MKIKHFLNSAACIALFTFATSCSTDEPTPTSDNNGQTSSSEFTSFVGDITAVLIGENNLSVNSLTRASMKRTSTTGEGIFSWEKGDFVYVKNDQNTWTKGANTVTATASTFEFLVSGEYSESSYTVLYKGNNSTSVDDKVTIASEQTQSAFNNTEHFKNSGDCAVGSATKKADGSGYEFSLKHQAAYLCILPYSTSQDVLNYKIKKVSLTSSVAVAGTYTLTADKGLTNPTDTATTVTLNAGTDGLALTDCDSPNINKSLYMVVAPGTGYFRVDVTLNKDGKDSLISKSFSTVTLNPNTINNIPLNLTFESSTTNIYDFDKINLGSSYYSWDAKENFWSNHEWNSADPKQPTENDASSEGYYNQYGDVDGLQTTSLFKSLPTMFELAWYIEKGNALWDDNTLWTLFGKTHTGGVWLKKREVIARENNTTTDAMKTEGPNGEKDETNYYPSLSNSVKKGKPSADVINDYFFLPAAGAYRADDGMAVGLESEVCFWGSYFVFNEDTPRLYKPGLSVMSDQMEMMTFAVEAGVLANSSLFK